MPTPHADTDGEPIPALAAALVLCGLVGWVAIGRLEFLFGSPYPWGVDGYFYTTQLRSLLETGALHYPSAPLSFWLMTPLAAIGGEVWALKVVSAFATALVAVPIYGVARQLRAERGPALLASVLAVTAASSFYFATEFVKNGVGISVAMFALWAVLACHKRPTRARLIVAALLVLAAWFTHKTAAALVVLGALPLALPWLRADLRKRLPVAAALAVVVFAVSLVWPERFAGTGDLGLLADLFRGSLDFRLPVLRHQDGTRFFFGHDVAFAGLAALAYLFASWVRRPREGRARLVVSGYVAFALLIAFPTAEVSDPNALGFRLRLLAFIPLALIAGPLLMTILAGRGAMVRAAAALALAAFVFTMRPAKYTEPVVEQHPALVAAARAADGIVPKGDVIITPKRRLVFMVAWFTRRATAQRPGETDPAKRWRLLPLPSMSPNLIAAINAERASSGDGARVHSLHPYDPAGMLLMPEATWVAALGRLEPAERAHFEGWPTD